MNRHDLIDCPGALACMYLHFSLLEVGDSCSCVCIFIVGHWDFQEA